MRLIPFLPIPHIWVQRLAWAVAALCVLVVVIQRFSYNYFMGSNEVLLLFALVAGLAGIYALLDEIRTLG